MCFRMFFSFFFPLNSLICSFIFCDSTVYVFLMCFASTAVFALFHTSAAQRQLHTHITLFHSLNLFPSMHPKRHRTHQNISICSAGARAFNMQNVLKVDGYTSNQIRRLFFRLVLHAKCIPNTIIHAREPHTTYSHLEQ